MWNGWKRMMYVWIWYHIAVRVLDDVLAMINMIGSQYRAINLIQPYHTPNMLSNWPRFSGLLSGNPHPILLDGGMVQWIWYGYEDIIPLLNLPWRVYEPCLTCLWTHMGHSITSKFTLDMLSNHQRDFQHQLRIFTFFLVMDCSNCVTVGVFESACPCLTCLIYHTRFSSISNHFPYRLNNHHGFSGPNGNGNLHSLLDGETIQQVDLGIYMTSH